MPHADIQAIRAVDQLQKLQNVVLVIQRLANAHQNDIGDIQSAVQLGEKHLIQYLGGCQVPHLTGNGAGTEGAAHTAAHLRGDAHGIAMVIAHQHRFDAVAVPQPPQVLDRTVVLGHLLALHRGYGDDALLRQLLPQGLAEVAHVLKGGHALVEPDEHLLAPEGRFSHLPQQLGHLLKIQRFDVDHRQFLTSAFPDGRYRSRPFPTAAATASGDRHTRRWARAAQRATAGTPDGPSKTM